MRARFEPSHPAEASRIFVVESDEVVRSALQFILDDHDEVTAFASLEPALAGAESPAPNIVLLGIDLMRDEGERLLAGMARRWPGAKVLVVANSVNDRLARASLKWGAHEVIGKPITFDSVRGKVDALRAAPPISPALLALLPLSAAW
jgi:DNA-binding NarL/FixJ family response regulator